MIIITGGAGFIGSNLAAGLQERGLTDIVICDTLGSDDKWRNIAKREIRDIIRPDELMDYLQAHVSEVDILFHFGAIASTTAKDTDLIVETNFAFSRKLWRWCAENRKRMIYASSYATYGDGENGFQDEDTPEALAKLTPLNPYGWSKHLFDRRVSRIVNGKPSEAKAEAIPRQWVGLKFFNVYGPNEYHKGESMSVAGKLYPQVSAGAAARLFKSYHSDYKDGAQLRDFVYIRDCVDVMLWFYDNQDVNGLYNVGTGQARPFNDLAQALFEASAKPVKINYIDMPQDLKPRYQYYTQADISKLRAAGYQAPFTSLEDGIKDYVENFLSKKDPYR